MALSIFVLFFYTKLFETGPVEHLRCPANSSFRSGKVLNMIMENDMRIKEDPL